MLSKILKIMTSLTLMRKIKTIYIGKSLTKSKKIRIFQHYETWDRIRMRIGIIGIILMLIRIQIRIDITKEIQIRIRMTGLIYEKVKYTCTSSLCWSNSFLTDCLQNLLASAGNFSHCLSRFLQRAWEKKYQRRYHVNKYINQLISRAFFEFRNVYRYLAMKFQRVFFKSEVK